MVRVLVRIGGWIARGSPGIARRGGSRVCAGVVGVGLIVRGRGGRRTVVWADGTRMNVLWCRTGLAAEKLKVA